VVLANPMGGKPPIDIMCALTKKITSSNSWFKDEEETQKNHQQT